MRVSLFALFIVIIFGCESTQENGVGQTAQSDAFIDAVTPAPDGQIAPPTDLGVPIDAHAPDATAPDQPDAFSAILGVGGTTTTKIMAHMASLGLAWSWDYVRAYKVKYESNNRKKNRISSKY